MSTSAQPILPPFFRAPVQIYTAYRLILALIFLSIAASKDGLSSLPSLSSTLSISIIYFILAAVFFFGAMLNPNTLYRHTFVGFIADIFFIALLEYTSLENGIALDLILIVSVAAGSIVFRGMRGLAIAAVATISLCAKEFVLDQIFGTTEPDNLKTAILGLTFFATAWISQALARRLIESEVIALKQAEDIQQLQNLNHAIIERMRTGVVVFSENLEPKLMNQAAKRLLSETPETQIEPEPGLNELKEYLKRKQTPDGIDQQTIQLNPQTPEIKLGFTHLGGEDELVVFLEDNTKIKQHVQQLKLASLGRLAGSIAHEIRNPLAAVSYATELLRGTEFTEEQEKLLEIQMKHIKRMNDIVSNVLQISRRQPPNIELIHIAQWLESFIDTVFKEHHHISIVVKNDVQAEFDRSHLSQVCTNLIENALHALSSTPSGTIIIETGYIDNLNRSYINVIDNGPGIPFESQPYIFEPFFSTSKAGSGLGLFLCREICELNHARIHLVPTQSGTCFQILLKPRNRHV